MAERIVTIRHVVRNALLPVITVIGYRIAFILSGTIVVETVFAFPGLGRLFYDSILRLDYQVVQAIVLVLSALIVVVNIITDLARQPRYLRARRTVASATVSSAVG